MKFKIDENLPVEVADALRDSGHDSLMIHDQQMVGYPDPQLASVCQSEIRTQLAIGHVFNGELEQAKRILDLITSDDVGNAEVVWALALYRAAAGDSSDLSGLALQTLKELDPRRAKDRYGRCQVCLFRALIYLGIGNAERASEEFSRAHSEDPRNVFVLIRWAQTLVELARESDSDGEHEAARICAEHAKSLADKVCEFDPNNQDAIAILETLSDDFNVT